MVTSAGDLLGQPRHSTLVGLQLRLDEAPYMDFVGIVFCHDSGFDAKVSSRPKEKSIHFIHLLNSTNSSRLCKF